MILAGAAVARNTSDATTTQIKGTSRAEATPAVAPLEANGEVSSPLYPSRRSFVGSVLRPMAICRVP